MANAPWMKWYPTDWRSDPQLRMCSLAARGLWIELIGYMHEAETYGHLLIGGQAPTPKQIAALVGINPKTVSAALSELVLHGVCSMSNSGIMYSRRMVRDFEKACKDRENGKKGGRPGLTPTPPPQDKAQNPEARIQKPVEERKMRADAPIDVRFYQRAKELLGDRRGGQYGTRIFNACDRNYSEAMILLERAAGKEDPIPYIERCLRNLHNPQLSIHPGL